MPNELIAQESKDKLPETFESLNISGQNGKTRNVTISYKEGDGFKTSGKISLPTRMDYSKNPPVSLNVYPQYVQALNEGKISVVIRSSLNQYYITIPVKADGTWDMANSSTPASYVKKFLTEGQNILSFSVMIDG